MSDNVYRIIQVAGSSQNSIEDAIQNAVGRASCGHCQRIIPSVKTTIPRLKFAETGELGKNADPVR